MCTYAKCNVGMIISCEHECILLRTSCYFVKAILPSALPSWPLLWMNPLKVVYHVCYFMASFVTSFSHGLEKSIMSPTGASIDHCSAKTSNVICLKSVPSMVPWCNEDSRMSQFIVPSDDYMSQGSRGHRRYRSFTIIVFSNYKSGIWCKPTVTLLLNGNFWEDNSVEVFTFVM